MPRPPPLRDREQVSAFSPSGFLLRRTLSPSAPGWPLHPARWVGPGWGLSPQLQPLASWSRELFPEMWTPGSLQVVSPTPVRPSHLPQRELSRNTPLLPGPRRRVVALRTQSRPRTAAPTRVPARPSLACGRPRCCLLSLGRTSAIGSSWSTLHFRSALPFSSADPPPGLNSVSPNFRFTWNLQM